MNVLHTILTVIQVLCALGLIATVMLQSGKGGGLGAITGGSSEGFMTKNKASTKEAMLATVTKVIAIVFLVLTLVLNLF